MSLEGVLTDRRGQIDATQDTQVEDRRTITSLVNKPGDVSR
jgi:hypothetical protein